MEGQEYINDAYLQEEADRRRFVYSDLELVIEFGYLEHCVYWFDTPVCFRTLDQAGTHNLISRVGASRGKDWKVWFVSQHVHSIGHYILEGPNAAWHVWDNWVKNLTSQELEVLLYVVVGIRKRVERCYRVVESYCYEPYSRALWRIKKHRSKSGGTESVHPLRQIWESINSAEDSIEDDVRQWAHTRSIIGSMSSKGAKSLQQSEEKFTQKRKDRARRVIEDTINRVLFGERKKEPKYVEIGGQKILVSSLETSRSTEDLEEDMMRVMRGEEDLHDMVVRQYKERALAMMEESRMAKERAREEAMEMVGEESKIVGYTEEQLKQLGVSTPKPTSSSQMSETDRAFLDYINKPVRVGWIGISGIPEEAKEEKRESLQDRIAARKAVMK